MNFEKIKQDSRLIFFTPYSILIFVCSLFIANCSLINPSQDIPSYIYIDKFTFKSNISGDTDSQNITDAWVTVDDHVIGAFELPAKFPVLITGKGHTITVKPGIKLNGISETRAPYPLYAPYVISNIELPPGKVIRINPTTTYDKRVKSFVWKENFESADITLKKTLRGDTTIKTIANTVPNYFEYGEKQTGIINITTAKPAFEIVTDTSYVIPQHNIPIFLELDYKTNNSFTITLELLNASGGRVGMQEVITINPSDIWKKIYVNLTPFVNVDLDVQQIKIYFAHWLDENVSDGVILLDNLKLVTYNN